MSEFNVGDEVVVDGYNDPYWEGTVGVIKRFTGETSEALGRECKIVVVDRELYFWESHLRRLVDAVDEEKVPGGPYRLYAQVNSQMLEIEHDDYDKIAILFDAFRRSGIASEVAIYNQEVKWSPFKTATTDPF